MKKSFNHPFHLVTKSPWPILSSLSIMSTLSNLLKWMHKSSSSSNLILLMAILSTLLISFQWWRDISRESTFQGMHTTKVVEGMKMGMILFITSEIMFFISFFWAFFHSSLSPSIQIGMLWPPKSIQTFNPTEIPMLNTIILLSSGASMTWAHNSILNKKINESSKATTLTIMLGMYFSMLQMFEYYQCTFTISDSVYGSLFFMSTGFHGIHVIIGTMMILTSLMFMKNLHFTYLNHLSFETAAWYWHFVDVVWLFLYLTIYWWGK
uniref:Cytochrome c oxidase subunit 3 n=1 Tax=Metanigrus guttatus TaxID=3038047 RepID=A0AB38XYM5_9HEMI